MPVVVNAPPAQRRNLDYNAGRRRITSTPPSQQPNTYSPISTITGNQGTYDPYNFVYTDPSGNSYSMPPSNVPSGTNWLFNRSGGGSSSGGSSGGGSSGGGSSGTTSSSSSSGGQSTLNPITGSPEYKLPSGVRVPANEATRKAIVSNKSDNQIFTMNLLQRNNLFSEQYLAKPKFQKGTEIKEYNIDLGKIQTKPYIKQEIKEYVTNPLTGKQIPVYSNPTYVDPTVLGKQYERPATKEEIDYYNQQVKEQQASGRIQVESPSTISRALREGYGKVSSGLYQANVEGSETLKGYGLNDKNIDTFSKTVSYINPFALTKSGKEFSEGMTSGIIKDVRDKPFTQGVLFAVGFGAGKIAEGVPIAARGAATLIGLSRFAPKVEKVAKIGMTGAGLGLAGIYAYDTGGKIITAPNAKARGEVTGIALKDTAIFGLGFAKGAKAARKVEGIIARQGRKYTDIQQGDYPAANPKKHIEMFKQNVYPQLGKEPGMFHTTSDIFWKGGKIEPQAGSSELAGLYGSTMISRPFARIQGSSNTASSFNFKNILNSMLRTGKPGVAFLKPKGFRYVKAVKSKSNGFTYGFTKKAKMGYADVPGIKSEIEAIARPDAGSYSLESQGYYTEISDISVPLDVFKADAFSSKSDNKNLFKKSDYNYGEASSYRPEGVGIRTLGYSSNNKSEPKMVSSAVSSKNLNTISSSKVSSSKATSLLYSTSSLSSPSKSSRNLGSSTKGSSITPSSPSKSSSSITITPSSVTRPKSSNVYGYLSYRSYKPPYTSPPYTPRITNFRNSNKRNVALEYGYIVEGKRKGKFRPLTSTPTSKAKAFEIGKSFGDLTLGRTFRLVKTDVLVEQSKPLFYDTTNRYRTFKIKQGKAVPLQDTFIQKSKYALSSQSERKEIKAARRASSKVGSLFGI